MSLELQAYNYGDMHQSYIFLPTAHLWCEMWDKSQNQKMLEKAEDLDDLQYSFLHVKVDLLKGNMWPSQTDKWISDFLHLEITSQNKRSFTLLSCHHKRENLLWPVTWERTWCFSHVFVYSFLSSLLAFLLSSSFCSHTSNIKIILNNHMPLKATLLLNVVLPFHLSLALAWHFYYHWNYFDLLCCKVFIFLPSFFLSHNPSPKTLLVWFIPWFYYWNNHTQHENKKIHMHYVQART